MIYLPARDSAKVYGSCKILKTVVKDAYKQQFLAVFQATIDDKEINLRSLLKIIESSSSKDLDQLFDLAHWSLQKGYLSYFEQFFI